MNRTELEREFHDAQAAERAQCLLTAPERLRVDSAVYLSHETWIRPAMAALGDIRGKSVLDYACGHGMAAVVLARMGAHVSAFDLSPEYVREAAFRAEANDVRIDFDCADGHELPYDDASFDAIWGNAVLHHLDIPRAGAELRRVLKPGGVAVFCEPWGGNALLRFARRHLPYPGKHRTRDEEPLNADALAQLSQIFKIRVTGHQLLGMVRRVWPGNPILPMLHAGDRALLAAVPALWRQCRYVAVEMRC
jgi:2-polyprenyl-3-methyl-5-hydroxy-6-metoxy-1,4-benzoquinol methylase